MQGSNGCIETANAYATAFGLPEELTCVGTTLMVRGGAIMCTSALQKLRENSITEQRGGASNNRAVFDFRLANEMADGWLKRCAIDFRLAEGTDPNDFSAVTGETYRQIQLQGISIDPADGAAFVFICDVQSMATCTYAEAALGQRGFAIDEGWIAPTPSTVGILDFDDMVQNQGYLNGLPGLRAMCGKSRSSSGTSTWMATTATRADLTTTSAPSSPATEPTTTTTTTTITTTITTTTTATPIATTSRINAATPSVYTTSPSAVPAPTAPKAPAPSTSANNATADKLGKHKLAFASDTLSLVLDVLIFTAAAGLSAMVATRVATSRRKLKRKRSGDQPLDRRAPGTASSASPSTPGARLTMHTTFGMERDVQPLLESQDVLLELADLLPQPPAFAAPNLSPPSIDGTSAAWAQCVAAVPGTTHLAVPAPTMYMSAENIDLAASFSNFGAVGTHADDLAVVPPPDAGGNIVAAFNAIYSFGAGAGNISMPTSSESEKSATYNGSSTSCGTRTPPPCVSTSGESSFADEIWSSLSVPLPLPPKLPRPSQMPRMALADTLEDSSQRVAKDEDTAFEFDVHQSTQVVKVEDTAFEFDVHEFDVQQSTTKGGGYAGVIAPAQPILADITVDAGPVRQNGAYLDWGFELSTKERNDLCRKIGLSSLEKKELVQDARRYKQCRSQRRKSKLGGAAEKHEERSGPGGT